MPAPFWPTMASDEPAGIVRSKSLEHRRARARDRRSVTSRKRISRAGMPRGRRDRRTASAPAGAIAGSRRSTAATGAAAPSSAQLSPPNAIIDAPTALCAKTTSRAEVDARRRGAALRQRPEHERRSRATTSSRLQTTGCSRSRVACVLQLVQARPARDEALDRPVGEAEEPQLLGRRRIDGEAVGVVGVALRAAHLVGVAVAPDRALAQQPVRREPRAGEHDRRPPRVGGEHDAPRRRRRSSRPGRRR